MSSPTNESKVSFFENVAVKRVMKIISDSLNIQQTFMNLFHITIRLRRPWTSTFFRPVSRTVGFNPRFKTADHVITFLGLCGLQNTDAILVVPNQNGIT